MNHFNICLNVTYVKNKYIKQKLDFQETKVIFNRCPVCQGPLSPFISVNNQKNESILSKSLCQHCSHTTFTKMPDQEWFNSFYKSMWDQRRSNAQIELKLKAHYDKMLDVLKPKIKSKNAFILDIGAGYGGTLNTLRSLGYKNLYGIEPSEKRWRVGREKLGLNIALSTTEKMVNDPLILQGAPYDIVYSWHVLEHVYDLDTAFRNIYQVMKPGGILCLGVPNIKQEHIVTLAHFLPHIHSFTPFSLSCLLNKYNFRVIYLDNDIRAMAVKENDKSPVRPKIMSKRELEIFLESLSQKFVTDLALEKFYNSLGKDTDKIAFLLHYKKGKPSSKLKHSLGRVFLEKDMSFPERVVLNMKKNILSFDYGRNPIFRPVFQPKNLLDIRNVSGKIILRLFHFAEAEFGASIDWIITKMRKEDISSNRNKVFFSTIRFVYPSEEVYAWIK